MEMSCIGIPLCYAPKYNLKWFLHFFLASPWLAYYNWIHCNAFRLARTGVWVTIRRASSLLKTVFYWRIVDLQCCVNFCSAAKWFNYICILFHILFHILSHSGLSEDVEYSSLCYTVGPCLFILFNIYTSLHLLIQNSQSI